MTSGMFNLNLDERFPRLSHPPIVESVIHWQARPTRRLDPANLQAELSQRFPEFPKIHRMHAMDFSARVSPWGEAATAQQPRFVGFRLESTQKPGVVQVFQDGVAYSVVKDYSHWDPFCTVAKDVWTRFAALAAPNEVQRLGVRFINHLPTVTEGSLKNTLQEPPTCPANLLLKEFVYQSLFDVPGRDYCVRVIKVLQPPNRGLPETSGLFLDLEAYTTKATPNDETKIDEALNHLRWLKNKAFFSLLTPEAVQSLT